MTNSVGSLSRKNDSTTYATVSSKCINANCLSNVSSEKRILFFRIGVFLGLLVSAAVCGYFAYTLLDTQESNQFTEQYDSLVSALQQSENDFIAAQVQSMKLMSIYFQSMCPDVTNWPNCSVPLTAYDNMTNALVPLTSFRSLTMAPIINASQAVPFESYALNYYATEGYPTLGTTRNGVKGIYAKTSAGVNYHDLTVAPPDSKYQVLVPIFIIGRLQLNKPAALYNVYSESIRAASINHVLDCSYTSGTSCGGITDVIQLVQDPVFRPAALMNYPIRAFNQPDQIVGMMASVINWDSTISNAIPNYVYGLVVVLDSSTHKYTFKIDAGTASFLGIGDLHDAAYSSYAQSFPATPGIDGAVIYTITVYPSDTLIQTYRTDIPMIACIGVVSIFVFVATFFFFYDYFVKVQVNEKEAIIATRRQFVNFISHEIRTPLNTISLGMKLLLLEMAQSIEEFREKTKERYNESLNQIKNKSDVNNSESLNNELNGMIKKNKDDDDEMISKLDDYLNVIKDVEDSSHMAITILSDILNYDKLMKGQLNLEVETFDIWDLVQTSSRAFIIQARQKDLQYDFNFEFNPSYSYFDYQGQLKSQALSRKGSIRSRKSFAGISSAGISSAGDILKSISVIAGGPSRRIVPLSDIDENDEYLSEANLGIRKPEGIEREEENNGDIENNVKPALVNEKSLLRSSGKRKMSINDNQGSEVDASAIKDYLEIKNLLVIGDKIKISQVIRNLISNALKFTPRNGKVIVSAEWDKSDNRFIDLEYKPPSTPKEMKKGSKNGLDEVESSFKLQASSLPSFKLTTAAASSKIITAVPSHKQRSSISVVRMESFREAFKKKLSESLGTNPSKPCQVKDLINEGKFRNVGSVSITVTDSGAGLNKQQLSQMFQEGVQFNANKLQGGGGSGLGLWISKGIVDLHHGFLSVSSPGAGFGCTFTLTLPVFINEAQIEGSLKEALANFKLFSSCKKEEDIKDMDVPPINKSTKTQNSFSKNLVEKILLVDDSLANRKMTARLLVNRGYKLEEANDGIEAIEKVEKACKENASKKLETETEDLPNAPSFKQQSVFEYYAYDVILMDSEMPRMSGPNATEALRQKGYKGIIIGVTGNVMKDQQDFFLAKGANKVLDKPLDVAKLEETFKELFSVKK